MDTQLSVSKEVSPSNPTGKKLAGSVFLTFVTPMIELLAKESYAGQIELAWKAKDGKLGSIMWR